MDREDVAKHAGIIPADKLAAFLEYLVRSPELPQVLEAPHPDEERLQGDLLDELPCVHIGPDGHPKVATLTVAVINNTCDLQPQRSKFVNVAPVFDFRKYKEHVIQARGQNQAQGFLASLERNKISEILYISKCPGHSDGVVIFLDQLSSISSALYEQALVSRRRIASFTQNGFYVFLLKMTRFLARAETSDVART